MTTGIDIRKGEKSEEDAFTKSSKPCYIGVFIYSFARKYMYRRILSRYLTLYQDTDSAILPDYEFKRFREEEKKMKDLPEEGDYGFFEEEETTIGGSDKIIIISPKNYLVKCNKDDTKSKRKFKGIKKKDTYLTRKDIEKKHMIGINEMLDIITEYKEENNFKETMNKMKEKIESKGITVDKNGELIIFEEIIEKMLKKGDKTMTDKMFIDMFNKEELYIFTDQLKRVLEFYNFGEKDNNKMQTKIGIMHVCMVKHFNGKEIEE